LRVRIPSRLAASLTTGQGFACVGFPLGDGTKTKTRLAYPGGLVGRAVVLVGGHHSMLIPGRNWLARAVRALLHRGDHPLLPTLLVRRRRYNAGKAAGPHPQSGRAGDDAAIISRDLVWGDDSRVAGEFFARVERVAANGTFARASSTGHPVARCSQRGAVNNKVRGGTPRLRPDTRGSRTGFLPREVALTAHFAAQRSTEASRPARSRISAGCPTVRQNGRPNAGGAPGIFCPLPQYAGPGVAGKERGIHGDGPGGATSCKSSGRIGKPGLVASALPAALAWACCYRARQYETPKRGGLASSDFALSLVPTFLLWGAFLF